MDVSEYLDAVFGCITSLEDTYGASSVQFPVDDGEGLASVNDLPTMYELFRCFIVEHVC
jgi:hypothetical protein